MDDVALRLEPDGVHYHAQGDCQNVSGEHADKEWSGFSVERGPGQLEHGKFNQFDKYKAKKVDVMKVADISQKDIDLSKSNNRSMSTLLTCVRCVH